MSEFKLPCNCQWQHGCGPNLLCPVHGSAHHISATLTETRKKLGTYELRIAELGAENQRLLRHLNRMNDIMCDALAGTALLGGEK